MADFNGKKVIVVGLGIQGGGVGLVKYLVKHGAKVKATDLKNEAQLKESLDQIKDLGVELTLGKHVLDDFISADIIFKGPSVRWDMPELVEAEKRGIPIEMEMSFFAGACPSKIIGITGTRGKSTTTMIIYELLKSNNFSVYLGGNIPNISTISMLDDLKSDDWVVLELASWPLSGFHRKKISPHISVFTNLYPDHLNYYKTMDEYLYDKKAIYLYQNQNDYLVANIHLQPVIEKDNPKSKVTYFSSGDFSASLRHLKGEHNLENAASALRVAEILGIDKQKANDSISSFRGIPYREEVVGEKNNVFFVNDTTSTAPVAAIKAINVFASSPTVLILGGNSKNLPVDDLVEALAKVGKIILLKGSFTDQVLPVLRKRYGGKINGPFDNLEDAVAKGYEEALGLRCPQSKSCLLFSPGATSFASFKNEFHRGAEFNRIVAGILK
jgi:UDP-N-acetylmuramoylalanine--D-glutamate ligase